ncbi:MAG: glycosyl transferase group 1 [uncultured bacterium]|nr:MAG: glycosyl transferase group 1 [uncultured bacterium]
MITIGIDASRANVRQRTGTEWYCYHLLHQFAKLYHPTQHRVILYVKSALVEDLQDLPADWQIRILRWPPRLLWTQLRLSLALLWPWRRPDVLFIPAHTIPVLHPQHTVYVAHDLGFEHDPQLYANSHIGGRLMHWLIKLCTFGRYGTTELDYHRWSMRYAVAHASRIIAISNFTKQELISRYPSSADHITVIHNGFDRAAFMPQHVQPVDPPYLFYVGRIEKKKNIQRLIEAWQILRERYHLPHQLWLAGNRGFGFEQFQPPPGIKLLGYVSAAELPQLMQQAAAFIFPSNYEGFGIPVLEALASGTKVACSNIPALREIGGLACWYFDQHDAAAMAQVIAECLQADRRPAQLDEFSWERCGQETWQVLLGQVH